MGKQASRFLAPIVPFTKPAEGTVPEAQSWQHHIVQSPVQVWHWTASALSAVISEPKAQSVVSEPAAKPRTALGHALASAQSVRARITGSGVKMLVLPEGGVWQEALGACKQWAAFLPGVVPTPNQDKADQVRHCQCMMRRHCCMGWSAGRLPANSHIRHCVEGRKHIHTA